MYIWKRNEDIKIVRQERRLVVKGGSGSGDALAYVNY